MSYEILYKKAFIKVEDKNLPETYYIPMVLMGSNNCYEPVYRNGRTYDIPEKHWNTFSYTKDRIFHNQILFTRDEITELAVRTSTPSEYGDLFHKTRNTQFKQKELFRWFDNGVKTAQSIEWYISKGNVCKFTVSNWNDDGRESLVDEYITTTGRLVELAKQYQSNPDTKTYVQVSFSGRELNLPKKVRKSSIKEKIENPYVIKIGEDYYFNKLTKYGYRYSYCANGAKYFRSRAIAERYMENSLKHRIYVTKHPLLKIIQLQGSY